MKILLNERIDQEILTQKEQNIASNVVYRKNYDVGKWSRFWKIFLPSFVISVSLLAWVVKIPLESFAIASLIVMVALTTSFFCSTFIAVEYNPLRRAICHMGRLKSYNGINNLKSVIFWIGWGVFTSVLAFLLGNLMITYYYYLPLLLGVGILGYFGTVVAIMTTLIPIDVHRKFHLFITLLLFLTPIAINILIFIHITYNYSLQKYIFFTMLQWILALLYALGYAKRYLYTAVFQKSYLLLSLFTVYLYINVFSTLLL